MEKYFLQEYYEEIKAQRKKCLIWFFVALGVYLAFAVAMFIWYRTLPYESPTIKVVKWILYPVTGVCVVLAFMYMAIIFKRVNKFYKMCVNIQTGLTTKSTGTFVDYNENMEEKDGVDMKSLTFLEWSNKKQDYFERKVLVFYEKPYPQIPAGADVTYITQGNVLLEYEIDEKTIPKGEQDESNSNGSR